jgi:two-component system response regulator AtoC
MPERILVVDDDESVQSALSKALTKRGYSVEQFGSAEPALEAMKGKPFDLVLLDVKLPGISGIEAFPLMKELDPNVVIIVMTGHDTRDVALNAIRAGAYDYFAKPFNLGEMEIIVRRALEKRRLERELQALRDRLAPRDYPHLIGESESIKAVTALVERVARLESNVLITGDSGTGKELVADMIHARSKRAGGPFIKINCAAIPETLLESELFGHERGAFTGAHSQKPGKFELAQNGTILLDEVGDMPFSIQAKLLRVVEQKQVERLGGRKPVSLDARIIASTNQDLPELIGSKAFRQDLYYRLNVASVHLPPLRERKEDVPLLVRHFLQEINLRMGVDLSGISRDAMEVLLAYDWPGNVRELSNILERAAILSIGSTLNLVEVRSAFQRTPMKISVAGEDKAISLRQTLEDVERRLIVDAVQKSGGVQSEAAKALGLSPKNLWKKIQKHAIIVKEIS